MEYIYIAIISGSIAASGYPNEEACLGHKAIFDRDNKVNGVCVKMPMRTLPTIGTVCLYNSTLSSCN